MPSLTNMVGIVRVIRPVLAVSLLACGVGGLLCGMATAQTNGQAAAPGDATLKAATAVPKVTFTPAEPFRELNCDDSLKRQNSQVQAMLRNQQFANDQEEELFDRYWKGYWFPLWTKAENVTLLPAYRNQLGIAFRNGKRGKPYETLGEIALQYGRGMAQGHFHPATRVNAMLMIGELNQQEAATPGEGPKPLLAAQKVLLDTLEDPQQIDAVKVAALIGLYRHAELDGILPTKPQPDMVGLPDVVDAMLSVLQAKSPPQGRSAEGHAWMRAQAAKILGRLKTMGRNGEVPNAMGAMVAEQDADLSTRCVAADALGELYYRPGGINGGLLAEALARLAVDACHAEADDFSRRRLKHRLNTVSNALNGKESDAQARGVSAVVQRDLISQIRDPLKAMCDALDDRGLLDSEIVAVIDENLQKIEPLVAAPPAATASGPAAPPTTGPATTPAPGPSAGTPASATAVSP